MIPVAHSGEPKGEDTRTRLAEIRALAPRLAGFKVGDKIPSSLITDLATGFLLALEEIDVLQPALAQALEERDAARRARAWTEQWHAERAEAIKEEAQRVGNWDRVASILANGTPSSSDPPTYAQQLNVAKHRAEAALEEKKRLREALEELHRAFTSMPDAGLNTADPRWQWWHDTFPARAAARRALESGGTESA